MLRLLITVLLLSLISCKKFLDEKPNRSVSTPSTIKDLQGLLDNTLVNNNTYGSITEVASDDYYLTTADWLGRSPTERSAYIWDRDVFHDNDRNAWSLPYITVYYSNVVLDALNKLTSKSTTKEYENIRGQALFFRSFAFFNLLQTFAKPYSADSADKWWGIALRLDPDVNQKTVRATLQQSYDRVILDLKEAVQLLPELQSVKTRPSKIATYAMLARVYQAMARYPLSGVYADSALRRYSLLLDYNTLNLNTTYPLPLFNNEVIFHTNTSLLLSLSLYSKVDTILWQSYAANDLRRTAFFQKNADNTYTFRGSYDASPRLFHGLATDELFLVRAEANAREGRYAEALADLNTLLQKRYRTGTFASLTTTNTPDVLKTILQERRKELVFRGLRWSDLRRLNKEPVFAKTLVRNIDNKVYLLPPNDPGYVFPIPEQIIVLTGMPQN